MATVSVVGATGRQGLALGRVLQSKHSGFAEGDLVRCFGNWADYSQVDAELSGMIKLDDSAGEIREYFGTLGIDKAINYKAGNVGQALTAEPRQTRFAKS